METIKPQLTFPIMDEFGYYLPDESLKEDLRIIDGVPDATYLVKDGKVFVFDKLTQLVDEQLKLQPELKLDDLARSLIAEATVSPEEAVTTWGIVPEPYELNEHPHYGFTIRHTPFRALLPDAFDNKDAALDTLASVLLGNIHPGDGDFVYRGQAMTLFEPGSFDIAQLPQRPDIDCPGRPESPDYAYLQNIAFEPGFTPITEGLFDAAKALELDWTSESGKAKQLAREQADDVWARTATLQLEALNNPGCKVPEYGQEDVAQLRQCHPELSILSDATLYNLFDKYQIGCNFITGWDVRREDDFVFYLLGTTIGCECENGQAVDVGKLSAFALLRGDSLDAAIEFGRSAFLYDKELSRLARNIADAIQFVAQDKKSTELRGRPISTYGDLLKLSRSSDVVTATIKP